MPTENTQKIDPLTWFNPATKEETELTSEAKHLALQILLKRGNIAGVKEVANREPQAVKDFYKEIQEEESGLKAKLENILGVDFFSKK